MENIRVTAKSSDTNGTDATVDLTQEEDGGIALHLVLNIGKIWHPEVALPLRQLDVDKYDMILAHHRDTKDEVELLQGELQRLKTDNKMLKAEIQGLKKFGPSHPYVRISFVSDIGGSEVILGWGVQTSRIAE